MECLTDEQTDTQRNEVLAGKTGLEPDTTGTLLADRDLTSRVTGSRVLDCSALLSPCLVNEAKNLTDLLGPGSHDVNVTQCARVLPPVNPSVHTPSLARCARDRAWWGSQNSGGDPTGMPSSL